MRDKIETVLSITGLLMLLIVLPTLSYVSAAPTFAGVKGGPLVVDSIGRDGFERYDVCPPGRYASAQVQYNYVGASMRVDLTQMFPLFGRADVNTPATQPFPYWQGSHPTINGWPRDAYVSLRIDVPADAPVGMRGIYFHAETVPGPALFSTLSEVCGDFTVSPVCTNRNTGGPGQGLNNWKIAGGPGTACPFVPGRTYYFNVRMRNPDEVRPKDCGEDGTAPKCKVTLLNNFNR